MIGVNRAQTTTSIATYKILQATSMRNAKRGIILLSKIEIRNNSTIIPDAAGENVIAAAKEMLMG